MTDQQPTSEPVADPPALGELEQLLTELKAKVAALREGQFDATALQQRLGELNELAAKAANTLDTVSR